MYLCAPQMTWGFSRPKVPEGYEGARALGEDKPLHRRRRVFELGHRTLGWLVVLGGVAQCWVGYAVVRQMGNDAGRYVVPVLVILLGEWMAGRHEICCACPGHPAG